MSVAWRTCSLTSMFVGRAMMEEFRVQDSGLKSSEFWVPGVEAERSPQQIAGLPRPCAYCSWPENGLRRTPAHGHLRGPLPPAAKVADFYLGPHGRGDDQVRQ